MIVVGAVLQNVDLYTLHDVGMLGFEVKLWHCLGSSPEVGNGIGPAFVY